MLKYQNANLHCKHGPLNLGLNMYEVKMTKSCYENTRVHVKLEQVHQGLEPKQMKKTQIVVFGPRKKILYFFQKLVCAQVFREILFVICTLCGWVGTSLF